MFTAHNNVMFPVYIKSSKQNRDNIPVLHMVILIPLPQLVPLLLVACWRLRAPTVPVVQSSAPLWCSAMWLDLFMLKKERERWKQREEEEEDGGDFEQSWLLLWSSFCKDVYFYYFLVKSIIRQHSLSLAVWYVYSEITIVLEEFSA